MEDSNFLTGVYSGTDDFLVDFSYHNDIVLNDAFFNNVITNSTDSSTVSGHISSGSFSDSQFSGVDLYLPYDDLAELEWLSNFKKESFSHDKFHNFRIFSTANNPPATATSSSGATSDFPQKTFTQNRINSQIFQRDVLVPCKTRSKRSRNARCNWSSRILHFKKSEIKIKIKIKTKTQKTKSLRCLHCGSDTTPQWRSGPMGPKTLCNACGVRFKSGRLVPEYRPVSSPSYVSAKHSNSHRKVMEIRRQKELQNVGYRSSECLLD